MFPILELSGEPGGDPWQLGHAHGLRAKGPIEKSIATYVRLFAYCGIDWQQARRRAAAYAEPIHRLDAALMAELAGIAAGAGRQLDELLALNARTELLPPSYPGAPHPNWQQALNRNAAASIPDFGECTAIAVKPEHSTTSTTLLAQNWDFIGAQRDALILVRMREPDGSSCLTLTEAGMLAKIGLNSHGFGVCLNVLRSADDGLAPGVPIHVLLRAVLKCRTVAQAQALVAGLPLGASSNLLCAEASGAIAALELSPRGLAVLPATERVLCHTNHFLESAAAAHPASLVPGLSTHPRLERVTALADAHPGRFSPADLETLLRDESAGTASLCRSPDPGSPPEIAMETVASVVMELGAGVMRVAPGLPCRVPYVPVPLRATMP